MVVGSGKPLAMVEQRKDNTGSGNTKMVVAKLEISVYQLPGEI